MSTTTRDGTIRAARGDDFEVVARLLERHGRAAVTDETRADAQAVFRAQVVDPAAHHMVLEDAAGAVVGFCSLHFRTRLNYPSEEAWIADLCVEDHSRGAALARVLLEEAERRAAERGCWQLAIESRHSQAEAHELFRRLRMRDAGRYFVKPLGGADYGRRFAGGGIS